MDAEAVENMEMNPESEAPETAELDTSSTEDVSQGEPATPDAKEGGEELSEDEPPKSNKAWARMRAEKKEAELKAARLEGMMEVLKTPTTPTDPTPPPPDPMAPFDLIKPQEDDFETFGEYEDAKEEWLLSKAEHRATQKIRKETAQQQFSTNLGTWMQKGKDETPDFIEVVTKPTNQGGPPLSTEMIDLCQQSPVGHQLLYDLAKNPQEVARLRAMPPYLMAAEITRREAKLSVTPANPKKISDAPTPIRPVTPAATALSKPLEELSTEEFIQRQNREEFGPNWRG